MANGITNILFYERTNPFYEKTHSDSNKAFSETGWFGLWCLTPLSITFQLYRGDQFIGGRNRSTRPRENNRLAVSH
jgi:hypothetical protein